MAKNKKKDSIKFNVFRWLCLLGYLACVAVLVYESCMDGASSANQSNTVGGVIADGINGLGGDQTKAIPPESVAINNKIEDAYVGESYTLSVTTLPEDATYKSNVFKSSDDKIATISSEGIINFLSQGKVEFTVMNSKYFDLVDTMQVEVKNVDAKSIEATIANATVTDGIYHLDASVDALVKDYSISTKILPSNTTFKNVTYSTDKTNYLTVNNNGSISSLKYSRNEITTITVSVSSDPSIYATLKVVVDMKITKLENIKVESIVSPIYPGQSITPKITLEPSDATFKGYKFVSADSNIVSVSSTSYTGKKAGSTTIKVQSTEYEDIFYEFEVEVLPAPDINDFNAKLSIASGEMVVGTTAKINISNVSPAYASTSTLKYTSLDEKVATVSSGTVKAISEGSTKIQITDSKNSAILKEVAVKVIPKVDEQDFTTDFIIDYLKGNNPTIFTNTSVNIKDYFSVTNFIYEDGHPTTNKAITYTLDETSKDKATLSGNSLIINVPGRIDIILTHTISKIQKTVSISAINDFSIKQIKGTDADESLIEKPIGNNSTIGLIVGDDISFKVDSVEDASQTFKIELDNSDVASIDEVDGIYKASSFAEGKVKITVIPYYNSASYNNLSKSFSLEIGHRNTTSVFFRVYNENNEELNIEDGVLTIYMNDKFHVEPFVDRESTIVDLEFISGSTDKLVIDDNRNIIPKKIGETTLKLIDNCTELSMEINIIIRNVILLDETNTFTVKGTEVKYDSESNTYSILNGYSGSIKVNFLPESTYTKLTYKSSNNDVLSVGADGTLTPNAEGKATITIICDDSFNAKIQFTINMEVRPQKVIKDQDLREFFSKIRKTLGHFGAFLVLGIFSTLTYMLFIRKCWFISIPLNFISGFLVAGLTELIQYYVPGRYGCWADVWIDYSGFICLAILMTICIMTYRISNKINILSSKRLLAIDGNVNLNVTESDNDVQKEVKSTKLKEVKEKTKKKEETPSNHRISKHNKEKRNKAKVNKEKRKQSRNSRKKH